MDPLFIKFYSKKPTGQTKIEIMQTLYLMQTQKQFGSIDKILDQINVHRIDDVIIVALVRCLKPIKSELALWDTFVLKLKKKYKKDPSRVIELLEKE